MRKFLIAIALMAGCCLSTPIALATPEEDAAYTFVVRQYVGKTFMPMAWMTASVTYTYVAIVENIGEEGAKKLISSEFEAALPAYQPQWNRNLTNAYAKHMSIEELESLAAEGKASKYMSKFMEKQKVVGDDMRAASEPLLVSFVVGVLDKAWGKSAAGKPR